MRSSWEPEHMRTQSIASPGFQEGDQALEREMVWDLLAPHVCGLEQQLTRPVLLECLTYLHGVCPEMLTDLFGSLLWAILEESAKSIWVSRSFGACQASPDSQP